MMRKLIPLLMLLMLLPVTHLAAQDEQPIPAKPLIIPLGAPPGPNSWLIGQFFGNTVDAFNYGEDWYAAGQRLHFGMDFYTPCGTPVLAAADGVVIGVDDKARGSDPHNLVIAHHDLGILTLYGHLLETPFVQVDQFVQQGQIVAYSGESQGICTSRPHLHLEVRGINAGNAQNPVDYIDAPWHTLALIGGLSRPLFQQDLLNPQQWISVDDQPIVYFWQPALNNYTYPLPVAWEDQPPPNPLPDRDLDSLPPDVNWTLAAISSLPCCANAIWHPSDPDRLYTVESINSGQPAQVVERQIVAGEPAQVVGAAPLWRSPDGAYRIQMRGRQAEILDAAGTVISTVDTGGAIPALSANNSRLLWRQVEFDFLPNSEYPLVELWVSDWDGNNPRMIWSQAGAAGRWLDDHRILIESPYLQRTDTALTIFDTTTDSSYQLGWWNWMRNLTVAPGGDRLMFYLMWQDDPNNSGVYTIRTEPGAGAEKLPFFGDWRWRDADSVYYVPFEPSWGNQHWFAFYDLGTGEHRNLTDPNLLPLSIANGDWAISADGGRISFIHAVDRNLWLLTLE